jgi:hypothetical protein
MRSDSNGDDDQRGEPFSVRLGRWRKTWGYLLFGPFAFAAIIVAVLTLVGWIVKGWSEGLTGFLGGFCFAGLIAVSWARIGYKDERRAIDWWFAVFLAVGLALCVVTQRPT